MFCEQGRFGKGLPRQRWRQGGQSALFTTTKGVNISRNRTDICLGEALTPCGHDAVAGVGYGLVQSLAAATIKPDGIGKIGCAQIVVTKACFAVAGTAVVFENDTDETALYHRKPQVGFVYLKRPLVVVDDDLKFVLQRDCELRPFLFNRLRDSVNVF